MTESLPACKDEAGTSREEGVDPESGLPYFVFRFLTFGSAPKAQRNTKHLGICTFDDETEKRHWMKVAGLHPG